MYVGEVHDAMRSGDAQRWGMFSEEGTRAVRALVVAFVAALERGEFSDEDAAIRYLAAGFRAIEDAGHDEIDDSAVRDTLCDAMQTLVQRPGFNGSEIVVRALWSP